MISQFFWALVTFASGLLLSVAALFLTLYALPGRATFPERLPRNKWIGLFGGWIALALCVPHAVVVSPAFLLPFLWPIAVAVPLLGFFYVDYPAARAVGGLLILAGYSLVHYTFDFRTPFFPLLAVAGWIAGIAGIWISAKPCAMRDYFRLAAEKVWFRRLCAAVWAVGALLCIWALIMTREGVVQ